MYLVTGTKSGLGKFLHEQLPSISLSREDNIEAIHVDSKTPFEAIVHCAYNVNRDITSVTMQQYLSDNLLLAQKLLNIPHKKFIFISSSDVYPRTDTVWNENDEFSVDQIEGLYGLSKLMAETVIKTTAKNHLILRPTAMLGKYSRMNSLMKILFAQDIKLSLSPASSFNYILHEDILRFIQCAVADDVQGTFNLAATKSVSLQEVVTTFPREIGFGNYTYTVAKLDNQKALSVCDAFANSSLENIKRFQSIMRATAC